MSFVYSTRFVDLAGVSGLYPDAYTVPLGQLAVVRTIIISLGSNITAGDARVITGSGAVIAIHGEGIGPSGPTSTYFSGRTVVPPGDSLSLETTGGYIADFTISGYLLALP